MCVFVRYPPISLFFSLADEVASVVVDMRNHLGPEIMPLEKFYVFER